MPRQRTLEQKAYARASAIDMAGSTVALAVGLVIMGAGHTLAGAIVILASLAFDFRVYFRWRRMRRDGWQ